MNKREFIIQFVLNRASAGGVSTDGIHWVSQAEKAWEELNAVAPKPTFPPTQDNYVQR